MIPPAHNPMSPRDAAASVPTGAWALGVSGGADSVALLLLLHQRLAIHPHVVHLDHQTRGADSAADAAFVRGLAEQLDLPCTVARRDEIERTLDHPPANPSARHRAARFALFRSVVARHCLSGVALAHHADDQAETVLSRLLRGSGFSGLTAMADRSEQAGLFILRPLLQVRSIDLRRFLLDAGQAWREDASNASDAYQRNRLRRLLQAAPELTPRLLHLASACRQLHDWVERSAPTLPTTFATQALARLPPILAHASARRWLLHSGVPPASLHRSTHCTDRLIHLASNPAAPPRLHFPTQLLVARRKGVIFVKR